MKTFSLFLFSTVIIWTGRSYGADVALTHRTISGGNKARHHDRQQQPHPDTAPSMESIAVSGNRHVSHGPEQFVSREVMDRFVPGTSPLQILAATTPGVSFGSDDPFGLDGVANTLYLRGFTQSQIGATLDGIPLGDQGFMQYNGLDINEAVIQDNISSIGVSQGAGAVDVPSAQNLGGVIRYFTSDPADKAGGNLSQTFGSNATFRTFGSVDSGALNATGTKFRASFARTDNDKWKGYGDQLEYQANFKLVQPIQDRGKISAIFDWSEFNQYNYMNYSLNMLKKFGATGSDFLTPNYAEAYAAAQGSYTSNIASLGNATDESNATQYDGAQIQRNYLSAITSQLTLAPHLEENTVLYAHVSSGDYEASPTFPSPTGAPFSQLVSHQGIRRIGFTQSFRYTIAGNHIDTGVWYENNSYSFPAELYSQPALGQGTPRNAMGPFRNPYATWFSDSFNTNTFQFHLQDTYDILPNLQISAGFRSLITTTHGGASYNNQSLTGQAELPRGSLTAASAFLPHVSLDYHFLSHHEFYIDIAENMRAYTYNPFLMSDGAWSVENQSEFQSVKTKIRPERTWTFLGGYRYNGAKISAQADAYHVDYYNRLENITAGTPTDPINSFVNTGKEAITGVDASLTLRPVKGLEFFNSLSYAKEQYGGGVDYEGTYYNLKGKKQVGYPSWMYKTSLSYAYRRARVTFNATYTGSRPLSYVNDTHVAPYWLAGLSASYNFGSIGFMKNFGINFNIYNLFNTTYVGGMGLFGYPISGDSPTLFIGAPRQFFGSVHASF